MPYSLSAAGPFRLTAVSLGVALICATSTANGQTTTTSTGELTPIALPGFTALPGLSLNTVMRISADGSVVTGNAFTGTGISPESPYTYTSATGVRALTLDPTSPQNIVAGISGDGTFAVGTELIGTVAQGVKWDLASNTKTPIVVPGSSSSAILAVSADGKVVGGTGVFPGGALPATAMVETLGASPIVLDPANVYDGGSSVAKLNSDGTVAVGVGVKSLPGSGPQALRWTAATGLASLGTLNGGLLSQATGVNAAGDVVVGLADDGALGAGAVRSFRWTSATGMVSLGALHGNTNSLSVALDVNAVGDVVVGISEDIATSRSDGYRWTAPTGMQTISEWLTSKGIAVAPTAPTVATAESVSANGNIVTGQLSDGNIYIARVVETTTTTPTVPTTPTDPTTPTSPTAPVEPPPSTGAGSGMITLSNYMNSLSAASQASSQALQDASLVMTGTHGSPMQGLISGSQQYVWSTADGGRADVTNDSHANQGAVEIGYAHGLGEKSMAKIALGRTYSDQDTVYDGNIRARGTYILPEVISAIPGTPLYGTLSAYYNFGDADVRRGYDNAGFQVHSTGSASQDTWAVQGRLDWLNAVQGNRFSITPYTALLYISSHTGSYTEHNGGFPVEWASNNQHSTQARLGVDGVYDLTDSVKLLGRVEGAHRFDSESNGADGEILGLSSFNLDGQHYKQNWMRFGAGVEVGVGKGTFSLTGNATTEAETPRYWASVSYRVPF
jgi:probable HAF family extracellular repeat protein